MSCSARCSAWTTSEAELDVARLGRIHVRAIGHQPDVPLEIERRPDLPRAQRPGRLATRPSAKKGWKEEQGQPWTDQDGAAIRGDFKLPARATLEFEISWKNKPDFVFALGVGDDEKTIQRAFRFEVWERDLIIQRETEQEADVASVGEIAPGPGRIHLLAYLDQEKGRILVFSADGKPLADLKVAGGAAQVLGSLSLANKRGDLRLERLRIGRWNGEPPREVESDRSRIHRVDGSIVYGQVSRFDAASKAFVIGEAQGESRIPEDQIAGVFLSLPGETEGPCPRGRLPGRLAAQRRARAGGEDALSLIVPGIKEPLSLPLDGLRSLVVLRPQETPAAIGGMPGVLELDGVRLPGRLVDGREQSGTSCLVWQPQGSSTASPLRPGVSGRIVYREPPPPPQPVQRRRVSSSARPGRVRRGLPLGAGRQSAGADRRQAEIPVPAQRRRDPFRDHQHRRERRVLPHLALRQHLRRPRQGQGRRAGAAGRRRHQAQQGQARAIAHPSPHAEGESSHPPDPLAQRRLSPRPADQDGRQDAPGRDPAGAEGHSPRPARPDRLAPSR